MTQWRRGTQASLLLQRVNIHLSAAMEGLLLPGTHSFCLAFPACWVRLLQETSAEKWKIQELHFLSISRICRALELVPGTSCATRPWVRSQDSAEGKLGGGVVVCCNTIWQGKLQEKAVLSRRTSSCTVVLLPWAVCSSPRNCSPFSSLCFVTVIFPAIYFAAESPDCL